MRNLVMLLICLAFATSAFAADRTVTVTPVEGPVLSVDPASPNGVCIYGNDAAAAYAINDWVWGQESYATAFNAPQAACGCAAGFTIEQVHFFMNFRVADVPTTFSVSVDFLEAAAVFDVESGQLRGRVVRPYREISVAMPHRWTMPEP